MQPGLELRLRAMARAMENVVLPSIAAGDSTAVEQAKLVIGSLRMLLHQIDYVHCYEVLDARSHVSLIERLVDTLDGQESVGLSEAACVASAALAIINDPVRPVFEIREINRRLRELIAEVVTSLPELTTDAMREKVRALLLTHALEQTRRERAWVAEAQFDTFPDTLRTIPEALGLKAP
jgi:hypothetical protein